jgi:hypothetical protein
MPPIADNMNVANHSFYAQRSVCNGCHGSSPPSFDINGGQSDMKTLIQRLRVALDTLGLLTQDGTSRLIDGQLTDGEWELDKARPQGMGVSAAQAGALYNYFLVVRGSAFGVHNPKYTEQLLYDSIQAAGGSVSDLNRPQ